MELEVEWSISMLCLYSSNVNDILMCIAICVYVCRDEIVECKKGSEAYRVVGFQH